MNEPVKQAPDTPDATDSGRYVQRGETARERERRLRASLMHVGAEPDQSPIWATNPKENKR
jgi:hypothetical protein